VRSNHRSRLLIHWIAILAILMAALAPAISQALGSGSGRSWVEVCTVAGAKWVALDESAKDAPAPAKPAFEHCPYCSLHVDGWAPASGKSNVGLSLQGDLQPTAFLQAPRTLPTWVSAQPRAPPAA
jgi:Protein of unknown function (DUF2946)